jgi:hypothetical protein
MRASSLFSRALRSWEKAVWRGLKRPGQAIYLRSFGLFDPAQFIIPPLLVK